MSTARLTKRTDTSTFVADNRLSVLRQTYLRKKKATTISSENSVFAADLFSGCGGLSLGIREACNELGRRFSPMLAVDSDINSLEVYLANFQPKQAFNDRLEGLVSGSLGDPLSSSEKDLLKAVRRLDFLIAGPPCQGHSNLNNHTRRNDVRNKLYNRIARFAEIARPTHILIENVPSVVHCNQMSFQTTLESLASLGYACDHGTVNLVDLGVPQKRKRHLLVASLEKPLLKGEFVEAVVSKYKVSRPRTVRWAIADLESPKGNSIFNTPSEVSSENLRRIQYLLENGLYDLPNRERPLCHQNEHHSYSSMYGRVNYDLPSQTITTGFGSPGQGRFIHPVMQRTLTPHEAARLQYFPDFFDFSNVRYRGHLARMIGNAVPMNLSFVFGLELLS